MLLFVACAAPPTLTASPSSGPSSGYYAVAFDLAESGVDASAVTAVTVAGVATYALAHDGDTVTVTVQGAPSPGAADVVLTTADGPTTYPGAFTYAPPVDPLFDHMVAVGASLTQGVQAGAVTDRSIGVGPAATLARSAGAYFPVPMVIPDLFTPISAADIGPAPDCVVPPLSDWTTASAAAALARMSDPDTGAFGFQYARVDPDLTPSDLAVAGSDSRELVDGPDTPSAEFMSHLVYDPYGTLGEMPPVTQAQFAAEARPTLIVSMDIIGNDVLDAVTDAEPFDAGLATPRDMFQAKLSDVLGALSDTGAEVFVATLASPSLLPITVDRERAYLATGTVTQQEMDDALAAVDDVTADYNAILVDTAAAHDNVHVVDLAAEVARLSEDGLVANGESLTTGRFGGLVSLDGVHFSDTGYARLANLFAMNIQDTLGVDVPLVDLDEVAASDPYVPSALRAAGLDPSECE